MTTNETLTDSQVRTLGREAAAHNDWKMSLICEVALGKTLDWSDISVVGDECTQRDRDQLDAMSVEDARALVVVAIREAEANAMLSVEEVDALIAEREIDRKAFWREAAGGDKVPMTLETFERIAAAMGA